MLPLKLLATPVPWRVVDFLPRGMPFLVACLEEGLLLRCQDWLVLVRLHDLMLPLVTISTHSVVSVCVAPHQVVVFNVGGELPLKDKGRTDLRMCKLHLKTSFHFLNYFCF